MVGWLVRWLVIGWLVGWLFGWLFVWLVGCLVGWLFVWLVGCLVGWLFSCFCSFCLQFFSVGSLLVFLFCVSNIFTPLLVDLCANISNTKVLKMVLFPSPVISFFFPQAFSLELFDPSFVVVTYKK